MSIEKLVKLVPPPMDPVEAPTAKDWSRTEKYLGPKLPSDFKEFVGRFGSGTLAGFFSIFNPCASDKSINLIERFNEGGANYDERHAESPDRFPYASFPDKPGLLPWGGDTNGNAYFWLVKAKVKPDAWTIVCDEAGEELVEHPLTFSEFLLAMLENRVESSAITFEP
ncbi:MAG TPA: SMI1/KNR4 family protein, partial [Gemmataceae bacterium]|nr:SMI1/KNR4 family protein [Gemmataceae bacterium]